MNFCVDCKYFRIGHEARFSKCYYSNRVHYNPITGEKSSLSRYCEMVRDAHPKKCPDFLDKKVIIPIPLTKGSGEIEPVKGEVSFLIRLFVFFRNLMR